MRPTQLSDLFSPFFFLLSGIAEDVGCCPSSADTAQLYVPTSSDLPCDQAPGILKEARRFVLTHRSNEDNVHRLAFT